MELLIVVEYIGYFGFGWLIGDMVRYAYKKWVEK